MRQDTYNKFSDRHIRNHPSNELEEQLAESLAEKEAAAFLSRFKDEPKFMGRMAKHLLPTLLDELQGGTDEK